MGETSGEIKGLIVAITFLSTFFIIVAMVPSGFLTSNETENKGYSVNVPEYFEAIDVQSFAETYNINLTDASLTEHFTLGGWNVEFEYFHTDKGFTCRTYSAWWIFNWDFDNFKWIDYQGIEQSEYYSMIFQDREMLHLEKVDQAYADANNKGLKWTLKNDHTQFILFFGFNETKYDSPSEALSNDDLHVLICVNFDKVNTTFNVWNLIGALLTFQLPNVHPAINMLISIPIWVLIAYLIYVLILKAIPFVG